MDFLVPPTGSIMDYESRKIKKTVLSTTVPWTFWVQTAFRTFFHQLISQTCFVEINLFMFLFDTVLSLIEWFRLPRRAPTPDPR